MLLPLRMMLSPLQAMASDTISHKGRIVSVGPDVTTVEIVSESACAACHAKGLCSMSESEIKQVQLPTSGWDNFKPGDEVDVLMEAGLGHKAVTLCYVIPLILLVVSLMAAFLAGAGELVCGLASIGVLAIYYLLLWIFRSKLQNEYVFKLKSR